MFKINLTNKFVILFLIIALVPLSIAIFVSYDSSKRVLEEEAAYRLYGIIDNKTNQIESYFLNKKREVVNLIRMPDIVEAMDNLRQAFIQKGIESLEYQRTDKEIRPTLNYFQEILGYEDLLLISKEGNVLFSTKQTEERGVQFFERNNLTKLFEKISTLGDPEMSTFVYDADKKTLLAYIIAPIFKKGELIGFGAFKLNHQGIYDIVQDYTGLGKTGEIILAIKTDNKALFIAPLRHDFNAAFSREIVLGAKEEMDVQRALELQTNWGETIDYRGVKTLASWKYLPLFRWAMVVKMDLDEVLRMASELRQKLVIISTMLLLFIILITFLIARSVSKPIRDLTKVVAKISSGDLSARAKIKTKDEIEDLANSFNQMTDNLLQMQEKLENKSNELADNLKKLAEEKEKLGAILYSIGDGVFVIDSEGNLKIFNPEAEKISDFREKEVIEKQYYQIFKIKTETEGKLNNNFIQEALKTGEITEIPRGVFLVNRNERKIPIAGNAAPLKDFKGRVVGCVVVFRDVTKEREIDRAKTEFVSLASHQLRTPLSAVRWYAEMLLDEDVGKINEEQKKYLRLLYDANSRMVELVNSLLNVSRIELGTFAIDPEPTNFIKCAENVIEEQKPQIEAKKLEFYTDYDKTLPIISADPKLLRIIFQNLISNAIKYTPEQGKINLEIKKQDNDVLIKIKDTGYGIPQNQQSKIFNKLFRADNIVSKETEGSGLGLYIVKSIVDESGGKIRFESEENKGTTFYVTIPLSGMKQKKGSKILVN